jgi:hypothetical protein
MVLSHWHPACCSLFICTLSHFGLTHIYAAACAHKYTYNNLVIALNSILSSNYACFFLVSICIVYPFFPVLQCDLTVCVHIFSMMSPHHHHDSIGRWAFVGRWLGNESSIFVYGIHTYMLKILRVSLSFPTSHVHQNHSFYVIKNGTCPANKLFGALILGISFSRTVQNKYLLK